MNVFKKIIKDDLSLLPSKFGSSKAFLFGFLLLGIMLPISDTFGWLKDNPNNGFESLVYIGIAIIIYLLLVLIKLAQEIKANTAAQPKVDDK